MRRVLEEEDFQEKNQKEGNCHCIKHCFHIIIMILISYLFYIIIGFGMLFLPIIIAHLFFKKKIGKPNNKALIIIITLISIPFSYILSILFCFIYLFICDIIQISRYLTCSNWNEKKRREEKNKISPINEEKQNPEVEKNLLDSTDVSRLTISTKQDNFFHNKKMIIKMPS